jgi:hypothetical protein
MENFWILKINPLRIEQRPVPVVKGLDCRPSCGGLSKKRRPNSGRSGSQPAG